MRAIVAIRWPVHKPEACQTIRPLCIRVVKKHAQKLHRALTMKEVHQLLGFRSKSALYETCWWTQVRGLRRAGFIKKGRKR